MKLLNFLKVTEARPKNISSYDAAVMIAKDDDLFSTVAAYTGNVDIWDSHPKDLAKFIAILNLIKPYKQRLYRGERGYYEQRDGTTHYYETNFPFTSWSLNTDTARDFVEGGILSYTDGPVKAVSLSDIATARMRLFQGESHYSGYQAEYFVLEPVPRANILDLNEAHNPNVKVKYFGGNFDVYRAYIGKKKVGHAQLYNYKDEKVGENERYVWKSAVQPEYKRQGVATALYDAIANDLESKGLKLVPSPDQQLSREAYEFWKARDPESIKQHGKYLAEPYQKYAGQPIMTAKGRPAVIWKVMASMSGELFFVYRYTDMPEGSTNSVGTATIDSLMDQLQG